MIQARCIHKFRTKQGKIYGYRLIDINEQTQDVTPEDLKKAIKAKQINVVNLTLTSDGRLMDKKAEKQLENKSIMPNKVKQPPINKKDVMESSILMLMNQLISKIGSGDVQLEPEDCTDDYLMGTIYDLVYNEDGEMFGITFGISNDKKPEFYVIFQKDCMDEPEFEFSESLSRPIESNANIEIIKRLLNKTYKSIIDWNRKACPEEFFEKLFKASKFEGTTIDNIDSSGEKFITAFMPDFYTLVDLAYDLEKNLASFDIDEIVNGDLTGNIKLTIDCLDVQINTFNKAYEIIQESETKHKGISKVNIKDGKVISSIKSTRKIKNN